MNEITSKKWDGARWETVDNRSFFRSKKCDICGADAYHIAIAEDTGADGDLTCVRARCKDHFNSLTQKTWLKKWRKNNCV